LRITVESHSFEHLRLFELYFSPRPGNRFTEELMNTFILRSQKWLE